MQHPTPKESESGWVVLLLFPLFPDLKPPNDIRRSGVWVSSSPVSVKRAEQACCVHNDFCKIPLRLGINSKRRTDNVYVGIPNFWVKVC